MNILYWKYNLWVITELCIDSENQIDVNSYYLRVVVDANTLITKWDFWLLFINDYSIYKIQAMQAK